jgi:hypothetical protein
MSRISWLQDVDVVSMFVEWLELSFYGQQRIAFERKYVKEKP